MKTRRICWCPFAIIITQDEPIKPNAIGPDGQVWTVSGNARGIIVRILRSHEEDVGLLQHELAHVGLFWRTLALDYFLGRFKWYRLYDESRAYAIQLDFADKHGRTPSLQDLAARLASPVYNFGITQQEAEAIISKRTGL